MLERPADAGELRELVADAAGARHVLEIRSGGSKRDIGVPERQRTVVELGKITGIIDYEPSELVITARPATPLIEVEALLAEHGQMLAFEPWDHGSLFGGQAGAATIGGVVAAGVAGPRRVSAGSARDHLLGYSAVSGRGEAFKGGGKVVKNVTGYDTAKLIAGSWGQLAIMTELSLKVVPRPRAAATLALRGLPAGAAVTAMSKGLGSRCMPVAAAHLLGAAGESALTALRLEGFPESVQERARHLQHVLAEFGDTIRLYDRESEDFWMSVREARPLQGATALWRAHVAPSQAAAVAQALSDMGAECYFDWGGALLWIGAPGEADVRSAVSSMGGHAMLLRAPAVVPRQASLRHAKSPAVAALTARVKQAFDPAGVLDPQRFA